MKIKYGKGPGKSYKCNLGELSMGIKPWMKNKTLKEISDKLAKQQKLENGTVELVSIEFNMKKATK